MVVFFVWEDLKGRLGICWRGGGPFLQSEGCDLVICSGGEGGAFDTLVWL